MKKSRGESIYLKRVTEDGFKLGSLKGQKGVPIYLTSCKNTQYGVIWVLVGFICKYYLNFKRAKFICV